MVQYQVDPASTLDKLDPVWARLRAEAEDIVRREPELATFLYSAVLHHDRLEDAVIQRIADRLDDASMPADFIRQAYLDAGVEYVIIGTKAVNTPYFVRDVAMEYPRRIIVGLDARDGKVAIDGWSKLSRHDVIDLAQHFEEDGVEAIIYTDISRDGMMSGVNVEATSQ